jgi:hypothetical protein
MVSETGPTEEEGIQAVCYLERLLGKTTSTTAAKIRWYYLRPQHKVAVVIAYRIMKRTEDNEQ